MILVYLIRIYFGIFIGVVGKRVCKVGFIFGYYVFCRKFVWVGVKRR